MEPFQEIEHIVFGEIIDDTVIVRVKSIYSKYTVPIEVKLPKNFMTSPRRFNLSKRIYDAWKKNKIVYEVNVLKGAL